MANSLLSAILVILFLLFFGSASANGMTTEFLPGKGQDKSDDGGTWKN